MQDVFPVMLVTWQTWRAGQTLADLKTLELVPPIFMEPQSAIRNRPCLRLAICKAWGLSLFTHTLAADDHVNLLGAAIPLPDNGRRVNLLSPALLLSLSFAGFSPSLLPKRILSAVIEDTDAVNVIVCMSLAVFFPLDRGLAPTGSSFVNQLFHPDASLLMHS